MYIKYFINGIIVDVVVVVISIDFFFCWDRVLVL